MGKLSVGEYYMVRHLGLAMLLEDRGRFIMVETVDKAEVWYVPRGWILCDDTGGE